MRRYIIYFDILVLLALITYFSNASEYGVLRPGGLHSEMGDEPAFHSAGVIDTLTWRSVQRPEANFGFLNPGDSLLVWLDPPAPCTLIAVRFRNMNFAGHPLLEIWDASHYNPKIHSIDSTDASGWWGSFDPITCPTCWTPGLSDHSPLRWSITDPEHHLWGPFPFTLTSHHENAWIEIPSELGLQGRILLDGDPIYISSPFYLTYGWGFAAEYTWVRPFPCFKFYQSGTGPDGIHDGWFSISYFVWFELIVKYFENTPPKMINLTHYSDTYDPGPFTITVNIEDYDADNDSMAGVASAELFYTVHGSMHNAPMTGPAEGNLYSGFIPEIGTGDKVTYWVEAVDLAGSLSRTEGVTFSRLVPDRPASDILIIWDMWSDPALDSFYVHLFHAIKQKSGEQYDFELWNVHDHLGINSSILNWGWNTIIVTGKQCDHTLPGRDQADNSFVNWLESGTSENPHNLLYIDQDYFHAHWEYGHDWSGELGHGDFLHDYFGVAYAISNHRNSYYDTVAIGEGDFEGIRINFFPDAWDPTYPQSNVWPDWIVETTEDAEQIFHYNTHPDYGAGVRLDRGHYKTVYFPWQDFFAVDSSENGDLMPRSDLTATIEKILQWFDTKTGTKFTESTDTPPLLFYLYQNYPNPFNPYTRISYQLTVASGQSLPHVTLKIYNILGQEVRTLVDEEKGPGYYTVTWDGRDESGKEVSSGVYLYRLKVGSIIETKKLTLLK